MNNALWADVHVRASGHLAVLRDTQRIHSFVVVLTGIIGNNHPICHHNAWSFRVGWEKAQGVARIHDEGLVIPHFTEVFHHQTVLRPILENRTVATIGDEFMRELSNSRVQVIVNHQHN